MPKKMTSFYIHKWSEKRKYLTLWKRILPRSGFGNVSPEMTSSNNISLSPLRKSSSMFSIAVPAFLKWLLHQAVNVCWEKIIFFNLMLRNRCKQTANIMFFVKLIEPSEQDKLIFDIQCFISIITIPNELKRLNIFVEYNLNQNNEVMGNNSIEMPILYLRLEKRWYTMHNKLHKLQMCVLKFVQICDVSTTEKKMFLFFYYKVNRVYELITVFNRWL